MYTSSNQLKGICHLLVPCASQLMGDKKMSAIIGISNLLVPKCGAISTTHTDTWQFTMDEYRWNSTFSIKGLLGEDGRRTGGERTLTSFPLLHVIIIRTRQRRADFYQWLLMVLQQKKATTLYQINQIRLDGIKSRNL